MTSSISPLDKTCFHPHYSKLSPNRRVEQILVYLQTTSSSSTTQITLSDLSLKEIDQITEGHKLIKAYQKILTFIQDHPQISLSNRLKEKISCLTLKFNDSERQFPQFRFDALALESDFFRALMKYHKKNPLTDFISIPLNGENFTLLAHALVTNKAPESPQQALDILQAGLPLGISPPLAEKVLIEEMNQIPIDKETIATTLAIVEQFDQSSSSKVKNTLGQYFFDAFLCTLPEIQHNCLLAIDRLRPTLLFFNNWDKIDLFYLIREKFPKIQWEVSLDQALYPEADVRSLYPSYGKIGSHRLQTIESFHFKGRVLTDQIIQTFITHPIKSLNLEITEYNGKDNLSHEKLLKLAQSSIRRLSLQGVPLNDSIIETLCLNPSLKSLTLILEEQSQLTQQSFETLAASPLPQLIIQGYRYLPPHLIKAIIHNPSRISVNLEP